MTDRYDTSNLIEDQYEPGSNDKVLRNLLGITSKEEMEHVEEQRFELLMDESATRFDSDHRLTAQDILWLHKFWLEGVFPWAGAYRVVNIAKGGFMFAAAAHVPELMRQFENDQLARLTPCRFEELEDVIASACGTDSDSSLPGRQWQDRSTSHCSDGIAGRIATAGFFGVTGG